MVASFCRLFSSLEKITGRKHESTRLRRFIAENLFLGCGDAADEAIETYFVDVGRLERQELTGLLGDSILAIEGVDPRRVEQTNLEKGSITAYSAKTLLQIACQALARATAANTEEVSIGHRYMPVTTVG